MSPNEPSDSDRADELEQLSKQFGLFGALSGEKRRRIAAALGEAAALERERSAIQRDRASIQESLTSYHDALAAANHEMKRFTGSIEKILASTLAATGETLASNEAAARRQGDAAELIAKVERDHRAVIDEQVRLRSLQDEVAKQSAATQELARRLAEMRNELADRERTVAENEGTVAAGLETLRVRTAAADATAARQADEQRRLHDVQSRLERDQAAVNDMQARLAGLIEDAHRHERLMDAHQKRLEERLVAQDARETEQDARHTKLEERHLQQENRHLEQETKARELADLDERLRDIQTHQEDERIHLNKEFSEVQRNHKLTLETWNDLKVTLRRTEQLETRIQDTNDLIESLRARTEAKERELSETFKRERAGIAKRAREIDSWRLNAEQRERRVQEKFNELEKLQAEKEEVKRQIAELESQRFARAAEFELEQQRQRAYWAERRAEAEKARELYERNVEVVDRRLEAVAERETEHAQREARLKTLEKELEARNRLLDAREERIAQLSRQRESLNSVIASLATQIGRDYTNPELLAGGGLEAPSFDALVPPNTGEIPGSASDLESAAGSVTGSSIAGTGVGSSRLTSESALRPATGTGTGSGIGVGGPPRGGSADGETAK